MNSDALRATGGAPDETWSHNSSGQYVLRAHNSKLCLDTPAFAANGTQLLTVSKCGWALLCGTDCSTLKSDRHSQRHCTGGSRTPARPPEGHR